MVKERIKKKEVELMEIFSDRPDNELKIAADLIRQAAFMAVTLEDLSEKIESNGTSEEYTNGANQSGRKISSDAKLYCSLISKYESITGRLLKMLPSEKSSVVAGNISTIDAPKNDAPKNDAQIRDQAFMDALKAGKVKQIEYREFCRRWEEKKQ